MRVLRLVIVASSWCAFGQPPATDLASLVKRRAAFELDCPEAQLTVEVLSDNNSRTMAGASEWKSFGVTGCGKRASYDASCVESLGQARTCSAVPVPGTAATPAHTAEDRIRTRDGKWWAGKIVDELKTGYLLRTADGQTVVLPFSETIEVERAGDRPPAPGTPAAESEPTAPSVLRSQGSLLERDTGQPRALMLSVFAAFPWGLFWQPYWGANAIGSMWHGLPVGGGVRLDLPILRDGFLPMLNDSFDLELGLDVYAILGESYHWGAAYGGQTDLLELIPLVEPRWTFYFLPRLAGYLKVGVGVPIFVAAGLGTVWPGIYVNPALGVLFGVSERLQLRAEVGLGAISAGVGVKL